MTTYARPEARSRRRPVDRPPQRPPGGGRFDPLWAKICLIIGSLIMVVSGGFVVVPKLVALWATGNIPQQPMIPPELVGKNIDGAINVLLLGMDERTNSTDLIRADTIMIVHIPASHDAVYMISLPRDTKVAIPAMPDIDFPGSPTNKINAAFAFGARANGKPDSSPEGRARGAALTMHTISQLVPGGLTFNAAAIINFVGFRSVLKAVGGVDMCIDTETRSIHYDKNNNYVKGDIPHGETGRMKVYRVGCYHLEYWEALDFARQRYILADGSGDYGRQRHQQQLLMAIFKKVLSKGTLTDLGQVNELRNAGGDLLTLDLGGQAVENWAFTLRAVRSDSLVMISAKKGTTSAVFDVSGQPISFEVLLPDSLKLLEAVREDKVYEFLVEHPTWISPSGQS